jgi:hypothetical protein
MIVGSLIGVGLVVLIWRVDRSKRLDDFIPLKKIDMAERCGQFYRGQRKW